MQRFNLYVVIISIILVIIGLTLNVVFGQTQEKFVDFNTNIYKVNILSINLEILYYITLNLFEQIWKHHNNMKFNIFYVVF